MIPPRSCGLIGSCPRKSGAIFFSKVLDIQPKNRYNTDMNFKPVQTKVMTKKEEEYTVDDIKMVRITYTFPAWINEPTMESVSSATESIMDLPPPDVSEATPSLEDLIEWREQAQGDWYFYHREFDLSLDTIIQNSQNFSEKKKKKNRK
jgi:hypothetical protein